MENAFETEEMQDILSTVESATKTEKKTRKSTSSAVQSKNANSLHDKLMEIRLELLEMVTTKSGKNNYAHFDYFQLKDFMPSALKLFKKYKIYSKFYIDLEDKPITTQKEMPDANGVMLIVKETVTNYVEYGYLYLKDLETGEVEVYKKKTENATVAGASPIQNLGAKSTYMKRYLYMDALEINIDDEVDAQPKSNNVTPYDMPKGNMKPPVNQPPVAPPQPPVPPQPVVNNAPVTSNVEQTPVTEETQFMTLETKTAIAQAIIAKGLNPGEVVRNLATKLNTPVEKLLESQKQLMLDEINKM